MADTVSKAKRSEIMSKIRSKKTKPELMIKELLDNRIFRYQPNGITGKPDFGNKKRKIAIFIDGCFWHGCPKHCRMPKSREKYWVPKIQKNMERDSRYTKELKRRGWTVMRLWEHEVRENPDKCRDKIMAKLEKLK